MTVTIMKKNKTRVRMLKNMGGNIPGRNFLGGNFPGGSFPDTQKIKYELHLLPYEKLIKKKPRQVFCEKGVLRNFTKFTGKHLCQASGLQLY